MCLPPYTAQFCTEYTQGGNIHSLGTLNTGAGSTRPTSSNERGEKNIVLQVKGMEMKTLDTKTGEWRKKERKY